MMLLYRKTRLILTLSLIAVYVPGVIHKGIWSDDYFTLVDPSAHQQHAIRDGRPLFGYLITLLFGKLDYIDNLWIPRIVGLIGILLLADLIFRILVKPGLHVELVVTLVVAFSTPAFQFGAHFATSFYIGWVAYFSILCLILIQSDKMCNITYGTILLIIPILIYPLIVFFIFPIIFLQWYLDKSNNIFSLIKMLFYGARALILALSSSIFINILILKLLNLEFNSRVGIISINDLPHQLYWFVSRPFTLSFRPFLISSPSLNELIIQITPIILFLFGMFCIECKNLRKGIQIFLGFVLSLALSISSIFFPDQQQIEIRFVIVGTWLVTFLLVYQTSRVLSEIANSYTSPRLISASLLTFSILFSFITLNVRYFSTINPIRENSEYFIKAQLAECLKSADFDHVNIIHRRTPWPSFRNLGLYSQVTDLASEWVPAPATLLYGQELLGKNTKFTVGWSNIEKIGMCNIDLNLYKGAP